MRNIIVVPLLFALLLSGCSRHPQYHIGVSQCLDDAWRQKMNDEMERELLLHPDMTITRRVANGNNELQCAQIDSFIVERVDLLIVSPNVGEAVQPAVSRAYRAGIPVIVADRRVSGNEWTAFIGGDNYRVGELMAEWIVKQQNQKSQPIHVLEVMGLPGSTPASLRHKGMMEGLARLTNDSLLTTAQVSSVIGAWYREKAYEVVSEYLRTHHDVDVIVAQNDLMAIGASEAIHANKAYEKKDIPIMGVDGILLGLQAIIDGTITCSATYPSCGDMVIETAAHILAEEPFVREMVLKTELIDASIAGPMLTQIRAQLHDLETFRIVQVNSDLQQKRSRLDRIILVSILTLVLVSFFFALWFLYFKQRLLQSEIKKEILPQLENVQEAIQISRKDEAFVERMKLIVEEHLTDPNLNVEFLGSKLQLSRTQVFRRVKVITGKGPLDYIRERRLIRADELLRTTDMTVQQVALELCFSSPGYFTKCYKDYFGHLPSER